MNDATNPASAYRVLARKYRPATFDDLIGQDAMVRTISNAFEAGRIPQAWILTGVRGVDAEAMARPIGPNEGPWAEHAMSELILHINREVIHHGAEIACIRDLYAHTATTKKEK